MYYEEETEVEETGYSSKRPPSPVQYSQNRNKRKIEEIGYSSNVRPPEYSTAKTEVEEKKKKPDIPDVRPPEYSTVKTEVEEKRRRNRVFL